MRREYRIDTPSASTAIRTTHGVGTRAQDAVAVAVADERRTGIRRVAVLTRRVVDRESVHHEQHVADRNQHVAKHADLVEALDAADLDLLLQHFLCGCNACRTDRRCVWA